MTEIRDDLIARVEAKRREAAEAAKLKENQAQLPGEPDRAPEPSTAPAPVPVPKAIPPDLSVERDDVSAHPEVLAALQAMAAGSDPVKVARLLAGLLGPEMSRKKLVRLIDKSEAWLSKRLGLLNAPKDIQRLIAEGTLSESEYYDNRANVRAGVKGRGESLRYTRMPTVTISLESARALALLLQALAARHGIAPIQLDEKTNKRDLTSILNLRAGEIRSLLE